MAPAARGGTPIPRALCAAVALCLATAPPAAATTVLLADDRELVDRADLVVRAEVVATTVVEERGRILTEARMRVVETIAGAAPDELVVRVLGGELPSGRGLVAWGAPRFAPGDAPLLFLEARAGGAFRVVHFNQGVFRERAGTGGPVFVRDPDAALALVLPGRGTISDSLDDARDGRRFLDWIRDRAAGRARPADYFVAAPAPAPETAAEGPRAHAGRFKVLTASGAYVRWLAFDSGGQVEWRRNERGQPGLAGGGAAEFAAAMAAWTNEPHTPVRYVDAGTTAIDAATAEDGVNVIVFDDPHDLILGNFCDGNAIIGAVAVFAHGPEIPNGWRGNDVVPITDAGVIVNDGIECHGNFGANRIAAIYTHELGHTLGLGHSGDGDGNPWAQFVTTMAGSTMTSGARIMPDDARGLRFLYDASFIPADCAVEGTEDYCADDVCGPCGPMQGDCDGHSECLSFLNLQTRCVENAGPQYGFAPGIDVCLEGASGAPAAPSDLAAVLLDADSARLTWTDNSDSETGFRLQQAAGGGAFATLAETGADVEAFEVHGLLPATAYTWRVRALGSGGNSGFSNSASVTTELPLPASPSGLTAAAASATAVQLAWTDSASNEDDFLIEVSSPVQDFAAAAVAAADATGFLVEGLTAGRPHTFRVTARNESGASAPSNEASATPLADPTAPCAADADTLCLLDGRFRVEVAWRNQFAAGDHGAGAVQASPVGGSKAGVFSFFNPANIELIVKALDATDPDLFPHPAHWFFYGALSTVEYWITVTDTATGAANTYHNPPGELCGRADTGAFPAGPQAPAAAGRRREHRRPEGPRAAPAPAAARPAAGAAGACGPDAATLCLAGGRFAVTVDWTDQRTLESGAGTAVAGSGTTGYFWFFNPQNVELVVKVLDNSQSPAANWWVFYGALSDVGYTIRVLDTATGTDKSYVNEPGDFCGRADTQGFPDH